GRQQERVAAQVVVVEDEVEHRVTVVVAEPVSPVVAAAAELRLARDRLELAGVGLEAEVAAADVHDLAGLDRLDHAARVAVGAVEPVVEAPDQAVDAVLLIAFLEAGEE